VICIVEAMKMMNQIEADKAGVIGAILVENGEPVEFDQPLIDHPLSHGKRHHTGSPSCWKKSLSPTAARLRCASCAPAGNSASRRSRSLQGRPRSDARAPGRRIRLHRPNGLVGQLPEHPAIISAAEITDAESASTPATDSSPRTQTSPNRWSERLHLHRPHADTIRLMGDKVSRDRGDEKPAYRPCPAPTDRSARHERKCWQSPAQIGYPVIIKAAAGGGGRGMRVVHSEAALLNSLSTSPVRSQGRVRRRHRVPGEVPRESAPRRRSRSLADGRATPSTSATATARCSAVTRRYWKRRRRPASRGDAPRGVRRKLCARLHRIGYRGAGTFEFLYEDGRFYFIEMNTRVQVEHPVTEMITGIDIVKEQLRIASGMPLSSARKTCSFRGHAFECRINAEDPRTFHAQPGPHPAFPRTGRQRRARRLALYSGYTVPPNYDSLIGKVITHGR
jgi:acetyl-CoA carboxylase, biotin carboxylase subunit